MLLRGCKETRPCCPWSWARSPAPAVTELTPLQLAGVQSPLLF